MLARLGNVILVVAIAMAVAGCDSRPQQRVGVLTEPDGTMKLDGKEVTCDELHAQLKGKVSEEALTGTCESAARMKLGHSAAN